MKLFYLILMVSLGLTACGQSGSLYLPAVTPSGNSPATPPGANS